MPALFFLMSEQSVLMVLVFYLKTKRCKEPCTFLDFSISPTELNSLEFHGIWPENTLTNKKTGVLKKIKISKENSSFPSERHLIKNLLVNREHCCKRIMKKI